MFINSYPSKAVTSLLRSIESLRACDHCEYFHHGGFPADEELDLTEPSAAGVRNAIWLSGVEDAFAVIH